MIKSYWQQKAWWEMLIKSHQAEKIIEINWIFIEKRSVSMWEYWLFILWLKKELSKKDIKSLIEVCRKENALFIQIENINYNQKLVFKEVEFKKWYYKKFIMPYTAVIDLEQTENEILWKMKPKWRYNIKVANKNDIVVREVEKTNENIAEYYNLMLETTSRDSFAWNSLEYYINFLRLLDNSKLLLAYKEDKTIAWWIFLFDKEVSIYYYWASTSDKKYRNLMAPYLLQWEAIKIAKDIWSKIYDFLWVASPWEKNSSLSWVTDFKLKLTKDIRQVSDSYIFINKKIKYGLIKFLRVLKK